MSILKLIPEDLHSDEKTIMEISLPDAESSTSRPCVAPIAVLRDISTRTRLERALLQAEKIAATNRMAATIAHEINNPLEAVMNLMYLP